MRLFAIYIGGEVKGANIEVHDIRFIVARRIEDTYEELRRQWWGVPEKLHLDCWSEVTRADGYKVTLSPEPSDAALKLYYVNLGGYDGKHFIELHQNTFVVAESPSKAKVRALKTVRHWTGFHRDDQYEAEQVICLDAALKKQKLYIHLEPIEDPEPSPFHCYYKAIGRKPSEGK